MSDKVHFLGGLLFQQWIYFVAHLKRKKEKNLIIFDKLVLFIFKISRKPWKDIENKMRFFENEKRK